MQELHGFILRRLTQRPEVAEVQTSTIYQRTTPGDPYFDFFLRETSGPVALFEVDDVRAAHAALGAAGVEIVGALERDSNWEWLHFRAPDGNLYELASRRATQADP